MPGEVFLDGKAIYSVDCSRSFTIDLQNVPNRPPGDSCVVCNLAPGTHVVQFTSTNVECSGDPKPRPPLPCAQATFEIVSPAGVGDPWANDLILGPMGMSVTFSPIGVCDVPPCDSIQLIQTVRLRGIRNAAPPETLTLTYSDLGWRPRAERASRDSQLTADGYRIDVRRIDRLPYVSIPPFRLAHPGRQGLAAETATFTDQPVVHDRSYPAGIAKMVWEFEVSTFCASGGGRGQWLGRTFWIMERDLGSSILALRRDPQRPKSREHPTAQFTDALTTWSSTRDFKLPVLPEPPPQGGTTCD